MSATAWADALVASFWQAPIVAVLAGLVEWAFARRSTTRHAIRTMALMITPLWMVATALSVGPSLWAPTPWLGAPPSGIEPEVVAAPWVQGVLVGWACGVVAMSLRAAGQWRTVRGLRRTAQPLPEPWRRRVDALARALGVRSPAVVQSSACDVPLVLGVLRPCVVLPAGLLHGVTPEVVEAALAHELMHLRRLDPWLHAAQVGIEIVLFFNPAVWWMSWRMGVEREHACDEAVIAARAQPARSYARALVDLEAWRQRPAPALTLGLGGPSLRRRVLHLVRPRTLGPAPRWGARLLLVVLLAAVVVAVVRSSPPEPSLPEPSPPSSVNDPLRVAWLPAEVRQHQDEIARAASLHGLDPGLLAIMVWAESRGRPEARSSAGARGLMQLMPSTAAAIAQRRGLPEPTPRRLEQPAYNLDLGAWYLAQQLERYQELPLALAAYNAGPGAVNAWVRTKVPLPEQTQRYQATIMALWAERELPWSPTLASRAR
ncbi:MAG: M56 family metallopeptidase [Myxococcota bacterium]